MKCLLYRSIGEDSADSDGSASNGSDGCDGCDGSDDSDGSNGSNDRELSMDCHNNLFLSLFRVVSFLLHVMSLYATESLSYLLRLLMAIFNQGFILQVINN